MSVFFCLNSLVIQAELLLSKSIPHRQLSDKEQDNSAVTGTFTEEKLNAWQQQHQSSCLLGTS